MSTGDRAGAMAEKLAAAARRTGVDESAVPRLLRAFADTLAARADIRDPNDFAYLHPARNALILLEDVGVTEATELCAAICFDGTRAPAGTPDEAVAALLDTVPRPDSDPASLLESLVSAPAEARRIALADRLDFARHLHLLPPSHWADAHAGIVATYLPVAERTDAVLARRFRWWTAMFARRWLPAARA